MLAPSDWSARWIAADPEIIRRAPQAVTPTLTDPGTPPIFRREFDLPGEIKRATIYATARGLFELRANGRRIGGDLFAPEWTDYDKRIHYLNTRVAQAGYRLAAVLNEVFSGRAVDRREAQMRKLIVDGLHPKRLAISRTP